MIKRVSFSSILSSTCILYIYNLLLVTFSLREHQQKQTVSKPDTVDTYKNTSVGVKLKSS